MKPCYITDQKILTKLKDYYYDNIHWVNNDLIPCNTFANWLSTEYDAVYSFIDQSILFTNDKKYTYFALLWL